MAGEEDRCAEAKKFQRIDDAFRAGDLAALRAANGETLITEMRIDRRSMMNGLFYSIDGMCVGGTRRLEIAPHLAYGEKGLPGIIPETAVLVAEVTILDAPPYGHRTGSAR